MTAASQYISYLLRLWLAGDGDHPQWRVSLEDPHSGQVRGFSDLEEMLGFLQGLEKESGAKPGVLVIEKDHQFSRDEP